MRVHNRASKERRVVARRITWWQAKNLRSARKSDIWVLFVILLLAFASIWSGNMMALHLSPAGVAEVSDILDDLQMPRRLPNAPLKGEDGEVASLWDLTDRPRTLVAFYAPWCAPCQKELPELVEHTQERKNLLIVVSPREDPALTRRQLDNLGLKDAKFLIDITGKIMEQGKVKSLPTTFLIGRKGRVRERVVGYSEFRLYLLMSKARIGDD